MSEHSLGRRGFLGLAGASLAFGATAALSGCSNDGGDAGASGSTAAETSGASTASGPTTGASPTAGPSSGASASNSGAGPKSVIPTFVERVVAQPDLPATAAGAPGAYLQYPAAPKRLVSEVPASGGSISIFKSGDVPLPVPMGKNQYWQELNKRVGTELKINQLASDYWAKLATLLAGGDLPDLTMMFLQPHLGDLFRAKFEDLSPWLGGDNIKNYPSLAARPEWGWPNLAIDGGLWGVPWCFGSLAGNEIRYRKDIFDKRGLSADITNGADLLKLCAELTSEKENRWAFGDLFTTPVNAVKEMVGVPNQWAVDNSGKFTSEFETEEYKTMLDVVSGLWKKGYVVPDSAANLVTSQQQFIAGKSAIIWQAYTNWSQLAGRGVTANKDFQQGIIIPPKWEGGGQAGQYLWAGISGFLALKKASKDRIGELLRVLDWFAAPFGSEEYLFINYGIADRDYTLKGSDPVPTATGTNECRNMVMTYVAGTPVPLYSAGAEDQTRTQYEGLKKLMEVKAPLPTAGLYSEVNYTDGATIKKNISDLQNDILVGRKPASAWDDGVKAWRSGGGDKVRADYERLYALQRTGG